MPWPALSLPARGGTMEGDIRRGRPESRPGNLGGHPKVPFPRERNSRGRCGLAAAPLPVGAGAKADNQLSRVPRAPGVFSTRRRHHACPFGLRPIPSARFIVCPAPAGPRRLGPRGAGRPRGRGRRRRRCCSSARTARRRRCSSRGSPRRSASCTATTTPRSSTSTTSSASRCPRTGRSSTCRRPPPSGTPSRSSSTRSRAAAPTSRTSSSRSSTTASCRACRSAGCGHRWAAMNPPPDRTTGVRRSRLRRRGAARRRAGRPLRVRRLGPVVRRSLACRPADACFGSAARPTRAAPRRSVRRCAGSGRAWRPARSSSRRSRRSTCSSRPPSWRRRGTRCPRDGRCS